MDANNKYRRRSFLGTGLLSIGALMVNPLSATGRENTNLAFDGFIGKDLFVVESGSLGVDKLFLLGLLQVKGASSQAEKKLQELRVIHKYRSRLTYGSNDRFKMSYAKALIDYFAKEGELSYRAMIFDGGRASSSKNRPSQKALMEKRLDFYGQLLNAESSKLFKNKVIVKNQTGHGPSEYFKDGFKNKTKSKLEAIDSRSNDLLQLADFLTGCIRADMSGNVSNENKLELINYLKETMRLETLGPGIKKNNFAVSAV